MSIDCFHINFQFRFCYCWWASKPQNGLCIIRYTYITFWFYRLYRFLSYLTRISIYIRAAHLLIEQAAQTLPSLSLCLSPSSFLFFFLVFLFFFFFGKMSSPNVCVVENQVISHEERIGLKRVLSRFKHTHTHTWTKTI